MTQTIENNNDNPSEYRGGHTLPSLEGSVRAVRRPERMKTSADANWTRLATALIETRSGWRRILSHPLMTVRALRELAQHESQRCTAALKHPEKPERESNGNHDN